MLVHHLLVGDENLQTLVVVARADWQYKIYWRSAKSIFVTGFSSQTFLYGTS
jgi:hypothetical protein